MAAEKTFDSCSEKTSESKPQSGGNNAVMEALHAFTSVQRQDSGEKNTSQLSFQNTDSLFADRNLPAALQAIGTDFGNLAHDLKLAQDAGSSGPSNAAGGNDKITTIHAGADTVTIEGPAKTTVQVKGDQTVITIDSSAGTTSGGKDVPPATGVPTSDNPGAGATVTPGDNTGSNGGGTPSDNSGSNGAGTPSDNSGSNGGGTPSDNTGSTVGGTPSDNTGSNGGGTPSDNTGSNGGGTPSDNTGSNGGGTPSDNTGSNGGGTPSDNTGSNGGGTPGDTTGQPTDKPIVTPPTGSIPASGQFAVKDGQIYGPDGQPFIAKGIAVYGGEATGIVDQVVKDFPGINMIRLAANPASDTPESIQKTIDAYTSRGIIVEVEDHHSAGGEKNTYTGQQLADQANWYGQIAANNKGNSKVWFGTPNEPDANNPQDIVDQQVAVYNAIRGAGNNNMVMMELQGGGTATPMQADASAYSKMTNIAWDGHYYGWVNNFQGGSGVSAGLQNEMQQAQTVTSADGKVPFIVGEYGNSTDGQHVDANGTDVVNAVQQSGLGTIGWAWNNSGQPDQADSLTDGNGNLTAFGQQVADHIKSGSTAA